MEVAQRVKNGEVLIQLPRGGSEIITVLQRNNMYLIGITRKEAEDNINNPALLSKYLYRVQKLSSVDYTFRLHTASTIDNSNENDT